jgi:hypothetical protein
MRKIEINSGSDIGMEMKMCEHILKLVIPQTIDPSTH